MPQNYDVKLTEKEALIMQNLFERFEAIMASDYRHVPLHRSVECERVEYNALRAKFF